LEIAQWQRFDNRLQSVVYQKIKAAHFHSRLDTLVAAAAAVVIIIEV